MHFNGLLHEKNCKGLALCVIHRQAPLPDEGTVAVMEFAANMRACQIAPDGTASMIWSFVSPRYDTLRVITNQDVERLV